MLFFLDGLKAQAQNFTEEEIIFLQRRLFQMVGIDLPDSVKGMTDVLDFLKDGFMKQAMTEEKRVAVEEEIIEHLERVRDEAENVWKLFKVIVGQGTEKLFGGGEADLAAALTGTPEEFRAKLPVARGGVGGSFASLSAGAMGRLLEQVSATAEFQGADPGKFIGEIEREGQNVVFVNMGGVQVNVEDLRALVEDENLKLSVKVKDFFADYFRRTMQTTNR